MRLIIAGSRQGVEVGDVYRAMEKSPWYPRDVDTVVSGTARGADRAGEGWAYDNFKGVERYPADWDAHGRAAGHIRNSEMADNADALLAIWDGKSKGTKNMIETAKKRGLQVYVHLIGDESE